MSIEELVKKHAGEWGEYTQLAVESSIRAALIEQAATHAIELRAYEATVQNLEQRIKDLQLEMLANGEPRPMEQVDGGAA
jgi:uncharacterized protein YaaN involved in tellurite resistance